MLRIFGLYIIFLLLKLNFHFSKGEINSRIIQNFAGTTVNTDGPSNVQFALSPVAIGGDSLGNIYYGDQGNCIIRQMNASSYVKTVIGSGRCGSGSYGAQPRALNIGRIGKLFVDATGNVYFTDIDNHLVRVYLRSNGVVSLLAGNYLTGVTDNVPATSSGLNTPYGIYVDTNYNVFIADTNNQRVRKVVSGIITTIAGTGFAGVVGNGGPGTTAQLYNPSDIQGDTIGNLYIADPGNAAVRVLSLAGILSTFVSGLSRPQGLYYINGYLLVADTGRQQILQFQIGGTNGVFAGNGVGGLSSETPIAATSSALASPTDIYYDGKSNRLLIAESGSGIISYVLSGIIYRLIGLTVYNDNGAATLGRFHYPVGVWGDTTGNLFITDNIVEKVRTVSPLGIINTMSSVNYASYGIWGDTGGNLYLTSPNRGLVYKVTPSNVQTVYAGSTQVCSNGYLFNPSGVWMDTNGIMFVTDPGCSTVSFILKGGIGIFATGVAASVSIWGDSGTKIYFTTSGDTNGVNSIISIDRSTNTVRAIAGTGGNTAITGNYLATTASINSPSAITGDTAGNLYFVEKNRYIVRMLTPIPTNGYNITTIIGTGNLYTGGGIMTGDALSVSINRCLGIWIDSNGIIYLSDTYLNLVRVILPVWDPSSQPTSQPSRQPTSQPSMQPTGQPVSFPTSQPTIRPSSCPTSQPVVHPPSKPTSQPSQRPSSLPSVKPSSCPSSQPTLMPLSHPSSLPSGCPSAQPIGEPSSLPSSQPSSQPSTSLPSSQPTSTPTILPSSQPSSQPSTSLPSSQPTSTPTTLPSYQPSSRPSSIPTILPSEFPISQPSNRPTNNPTIGPSAQPSSLPSSSPTYYPTVFPSLKPSSRPSLSPTAYPTSKPSFHPSASPSSHPTIKASTFPPSQLPSSIPPTGGPSQPSSVSPSISPSRPPNTFPSLLPSMEPSPIPSAIPTPSSTIIRVINVSTLPPTITPSPIPSLKPSTASTFTNSLLPKATNVTVLSKVFPIRFKESLLLLGTTKSVPSPVLTDINHLDLPSRNVGRSYVVLGGKTFPPLVDLSEAVSMRHSGVNVFEYDASLAVEDLVRSVAIVGDVNDDGIDDLLIGDPAASKAYILYGVGGRNALNPWKEMNSGYVISSPSSYDYLGWAVSAAGDFNSDGIDDVIVSAILLNRCYVVFGKSTSRQGLKVGDVMDSSEGLTISMTSARTLGLAVAGGYDFNGDGIADVVMSGTLTASSSDVANVIYVVYGGVLTASQGSISLDVILMSGGGFKIVAPVLSFAGMSLDMVKDINGDGFADIVIGSIPYQGQYITQRSYVVYGRNTSGALTLKDMTKEDGVVIVGGGLIVSAIGDINQDGYDDIMVSEYNSWQGKSRAYTIVYPQIGSISLYPTVLPSSQPSILVNTSSPSCFPSITPTRLPTTPTATPSLHPTGPSQLPTCLPSSPTMTPTRTPTCIPSLKPSIRPSMLPTIRPTTTQTPTVAPTAMKTIPPSTRFPSPLPTRHPTTRPTRFQTQHPTILTTPSPILSFNTTSIMKSGVYSFTGGVNYDITVTASDGDVTLVMSKGGKDCQRIYRISILPSIAIVIEGFEVANDVIDVQAFEGTKNITDLSYSTPPLMILLPNKQTVVMPSLSSLSQLSTKNFLFSNMRSSVSNGGSGDGGKGLSAMKADLIITTILFSCCLFVFIAQICYKENEKKQKREEDIIEGNENNSVLIVERKVEEEEDYADNENSFVPVDIEVEDSNISWESDVDEEDNEKIVSDLQTSSSSSSSHSSSSLSSIIQSMKSGESSSYKSFSSVKDDVELNDFY